MNEQYVFTLPENFEPVPETPEQQAPMIDPQDPFENETEFRDYNPDYGEVVPQIRIPGCRIPRLPNQRERSRIRRYHNIVGGFLIGHFLITYVLAVLILVLFDVLTTMVDTAAVGDLPENYKTLLSDYVESSSAMLGISVLVYGLCNVLMAVFGCKLTKIPLPNLFQTKNFSPLLLLGYAGVALLLQTVTGYLAEWMTDLFAGVGITLYEADFGTCTSLRYTALSFAYSVIVAPITEELLMRGFVMKNLSRSSQHFGIIMSAFLFGIWHENVAQFLLAFAAGCFFGYIVAKHNSLVPSILCHMVVNFFAEMFGIADTYEWDIVSTGLNLVYMGFVLIGIEMLIYLYVAERFPRTTPAQAERGIRITVTSPLMILLVVCHVGAAVLYILQASEII